MAEDKSRSKRQFSEAEVKDVWGRVRQKIAINDALSLYRYRQADAAGGNKPRLTGGFFLAQECSSDA